MEGGPPGFRQGFTCPALLGIPLGRVVAFGYGAFTLCRRTFQTVHLTFHMPRRGPATPESMPSGLGWCAFARHYLRSLC